MLVIDLQLAIEEFGEGNIAPRSTEGEFKIAASWIAERLIRLEES